MPVIINFQTTEKLEAVDKIKQVNQYYFHNFQINLDNDDFEFNMEGVLDANARVEKYGIPFHPHVKTSGIKDAASSLDLSLVSRNLTYSVGGMADYIVIDLELNIKSNQQYFWIEGDFINSDKTFLASNKEFQALDISFSSMDEYLVGYRNSCPDYPKSDAKQIDLTEACSNDVEKIKGAVAFKSFHIYFLVKTKHGGILSFSRDIEPQGTH